MILIVSQQVVCDCVFVLSSYCLLLLMTLIPLPARIPSFPDVYLGIYYSERERERGRERKTRFLGITVETFDGS